VAGINQAGLSISTVALTSPATGQFDPTMPVLLGSCRTLRDVQAGLSRGVGDMDPRRRSFELAAAYAAVAPSSAGIIEYVRSANRLDWSCRTFDLADPARRGLPAPDGGTWDLTGLIAREQGGGWGPDAVAGASMVKDFAEVAASLEAPEPASPELARRWTRQLLALREAGAVDLQAVLQYARSDTPDGPNSQAGEGEALLIFQSAPRAGKLSTLWALMGPAQYSIALPVWPAAVGAGDDGGLPGGLQSVITAQSMACQAAILAGRNYRPDLITRRTLPVERQLIRCVTRRLIPAWKELNWDDPAEAAAGLSQMARVQQRASADAVSVLAGLRRLGSVANGPPEARITDCVTEGLRVSLQGRMTDAEDADKVDYLWDYGDGVTGRRGRHTYDAAGSYLVTLTVTDRNGVSRSDFRSVRVEGYPPVPKGDRPVDELRRRRRVRPEKVVTAGGSARQSRRDRGGDLPAVAALAVALLLMMGVVSAWRLRRRTAAEAAGPKLRLRK
jgi:hypothetical protein